jgi:superfamily II DNA/RNA helicase
MPLSVPQAEASKAWKAAPGHLLLADQAGSGKTLGYLLPLVQEMRQKELRDGRATTSYSPQVVVLTPTTELAQQVRGGAAGGAAGCAAVAAVVTARGAVCLGVHRQQ